MKSINKLIVIGCSIFLMSLSISHGLINTQNATTSQKAFHAAKCLGTLSGFFDLNFPTPATPIYQVKNGQIAADPNPQDCDYVRDDVLSKMLEKSGQYSNSGFNLLQLDGMYLNLHKISITQDFLLHQDSNKCQDDYIGMPFPDLGDNSCAIASSDSSITSQKTRMENSFKNGVEEGKQLRDANSEKQNEVINESIEFITKFSDEMTNQVTALNKEPHAHGLLRGSELFLQKRCKEYRTNKAELDKKAELIERNKKRGLCVKECLHDFSPSQTADQDQELN